jgi:hypothetical protein
VDRATTFTFRTKKYREPLKMRPREHSTIRFIHGIESVKEYCIEARAGPGIPGAWAFVIMTQRRYGEGDECWLLNSREERLDARVSAVSKIGEFYRVTIGTIIPSDWEKE